MRDGINIYPLWPLDIQIINSIRQNTMVRLAESATLVPNMKDVYISAQSQDTKLPPLDFPQFMEYIQKLKQSRWDCIRRLQLPQNQQQTLFKGHNDTLSDDELFILAKRIYSERRNIEYPNLRLLRESNFISVYEPSSVKVPRTRSNLALTNVEREFIFSCQPHPMCYPKPNEPYWGDCLDFSEMNECITYRTAELQAQKLKVFIDQL